MNMGTSTLTLILASTFALAAIAWIGAVSVALSPERFTRVLLTLVAFAAGSLLSGALLHMLPEALQQSGQPDRLFLWTIVGFGLFFLLEQFLSWHHAHSPDAKAPVTYLILLADGLHNLIGGLAIGASFMISPEIGFVTFVVAAAHEVPQELGDFAILVRGGWTPRRALLVNFLSALTIVPGGLVAYALGGAFDTTILMALAAGNFIYIASSDLIPEVKHEIVLRTKLLHVVAFGAGVGLIPLSRALIGG
jgi:zinc and cadmium transporter